MLAALAACLALSAEPNVAIPGAWLSLSGTPVVEASATTGRFLQSLRETKGLDQLSSWDMISGGTWIRISLETYPKSSKPKETVQELAETVWRAHALMRQSTKPEQLSEFDQMTARKFSNRKSFARNLGAYPGHVDASTNLNNKNAKRNWAWGDDSRRWLAEVSVSGIGEASNAAADAILDSMRVIEPTEDKIRSTPPIICRMPQLGLEIFSPGAFTVTDDSDPYSSRRETASYIAVLRFGQKLDAQMNVTFLDPKSKTYSAESNVASFDKWFARNGVKWTKRAESSTTLGGMSGKRVEYQFAQGDRKMTRTSIFVCKPGAEYVFQFDLAESLGGFKVASALIGSLKFSTPKA